MSIKYCVYFWDHKKQLAKSVGEEVHYSIISRYSHICNNLETVYTVIWFFIEKKTLRSEVHKDDRLMEFLCCLRFLQTLKASSQKEVGLSICLADWIIYLTDLWPVVGPADWEPLHLLIDRTYLDSSSLYPSLSLSKLPSLHMCF